MNFLPFALGMPSHRLMKHNFNVCIGNQAKKRFSRFYTEGIPSGQDRRVCHRHPYGATTPLHRSPTDQPSVFVISQVVQNYFNNYLSTKGMNRRSAS